MDSLMILGTTPENTLALTKFCLEHSTAFSFSYDKNTARLNKRESPFVWESKKAPKLYTDILNQLEPFRLDDADFEAPPRYAKGIRTLYYRVTPETKSIVLSLPMLFYASHLNYPEDLSFYNKKALWLYSVTHECLIFITKFNEAIKQEVLTIGLQIDDA